MSTFLKRLKDELQSLKGVMYHRFFVSAKVERSIVDEFHRLYYDSHILARTRGTTLWLGIPVAKCPLDLWVYQEIIYEVRPDIIIESGTWCGGTALFLASICDLVGNGKIVSIDIEDKEGRPKHERIEYILGSSTSAATVEKVKELIKNKDIVIVILDSDHQKEHVLSELNVYSRFVRKGGYIIVEDTNINGHPVASDFGPGPMEAVGEFCRESGDFAVDRTRHKFYLTFNPNGYLRRVR